MTGWADSWAGPTRPIPVGGENRELRQELRFGLIGAGPWGRKILTTVNALPGLCLAAVASRNPDTRALVGNSCTVHQDWHLVAADKDLDGVLIATPAGLHHQMARHALDAGLATFVEKPFTLDPAEAGDLRDRAKAAGVPVQVDHIHLHNAAYQALKARVADHGGPLTVQMVSGGWGPFRADCGPLWDWGSHDLALALDLVGGKPLAVAAHPLEQRITDDGPGALWRITLRFPGEVTVGITTGNILTPKTRWLEASCDGATFVFDDLAPDPLVGGATPPLANAIASFAEAINGERDWQADLDLAVSVVEILTACDPATA